MIAITESRETSLVAGEIIRGQRTIGSEESQEAVARHIFQEDRGEDHPSCRGRLHDGHPAAMCEPANRHLHPQGGQERKHAQVCMDARKRVRVASEPEYP